MTNEEYHKYDETNRLLAEFEGLETMVRHPRTQEWTGARFNYHNSWGSLMSVVEKIESLDVTVEIEGHNCMISDIKDGGYYEYVAHDSKINAVYVSVVAFIKWYNENKQQ